jgi:DNA-binding NarL/FixJ family response regulator
MLVYKDDHRIFLAICAGARGYLLKNTAPASLMEAIQEIAKGGAVRSPEVARARCVKKARRVPCCAKDEGRSFGVAL